MEVVMSNKDRSVEQNPEENQFINDKENKGKGSHSSYDGNLNKSEDENPEKYTISE